MQKTLIETRDCGHPCALAAIEPLLGPRVGWPSDKILADLLECD